MRAITLFYLSFFILLQAVSAHSLNLTNKLKSSRKLLLCLASEDKPKKRDASSSKKAQKLTSPIDINSADVKTLTLLPGIGVKTAEKIVQYRNENGEFFYKDELMDVRGVNKSKYEVIKNLITLGSPNYGQELLNLKRWTMKDFIDIGFPPSLSLKLVLFIHDKKLYSQIDDLLEVNEMDQSKLSRLKEKLRELEDQD